MPHGATEAAFRYARPRHAPSHHCHGAAHLSEVRPDRHWPQPRQSQQVRQAERVAREEQIGLNDYEPLIIRAGNCVRYEGSPWEPLGLVSAIGGTIGLLGPWLL